MNQPKLKILQVIQSMGKGGAERYAADLTIALQKDGHTVKLVSFEDCNAYPFLTDQIDYQFIDASVQPSISSSHQINTKAFDDLVKTFQPDIIHSHLFKAEMTARQNINPSTAYFTSCQNNMPEFANWQPSKAFKKITYTRLYEKRWMIKKYLECDNNFIAISKDTEQYYRAMLPDTLKKNIRLIYHAIDFEKFNAAAHNRMDSLNEINLVYVARYATYKNHIFLMDVVNEIRSQNIPVSLTLLGEGPEMQNTKNRAKELNIEGHVHFLGNVNNVEEHLHKANLYVHPATYEPFGLVIIEAMAAGLPAICLNGKGNKDLIENGVNGYMQDDIDPIKYANRIMETMKNPVLYKELSLHAISYAKEYDINTHAQTILSYYQMGLDNRSYRDYASNSCFAKSE